MTPDTVKNCFEPPQLREAASPQTPKSRCTTLSSRLTGKMPSAFAAVAGSVGCMAMPPGAKTPGKATRTQVDTRWAIRAKIPHDVCEHDRLSERLQECTSRASTGRIGIRHAHVS